MFHWPELDQMPTPDKALAKAIFLLIKTLHSQLG